MFVMMSITHVIHSTLLMQEESKLYIFIELVTQGSLSSLYQKYKLRDSQVSAYTRQILNGLVYLHERNVVHRYKDASLIFSIENNSMLMMLQITKGGLLSSFVIHFKCE